MKTEVIKEICELYSYELLAIGDEYLYLLDCYTSEKIIVPIADWLLEKMEETELRLLGYDHSASTIDGYLKIMKKISEVL